MSPLLMVPTRVAAAVGRTVDVNGELLDDVTRLARDRCSGRRRLGNYRGSCQLGGGEHGEQRHGRRPRTHHAPGPSAWMPCCLSSAAHVRAAAAELDERLERDRGCRRG